jgi:hypothetical protein
MSSAWRCLPPSDADFGRVGQDARRASQRQEMKRKPLRPTTTKVPEASPDRLRTDNGYTGEKECEQQREPAHERTEYYVHSRVTPVFSERGPEIAERNSRDRGKFFTQRWAPFLEICGRSKFILSYLAPRASANELNLWQACIRQSVNNFDPRSILKMAALL